MRKLLALGIALGLSSISFSAAARVYIWHYDGIVTSVNDPTAVFRGFDLLGKQASAGFVYEDVDPRTVDTQPGQQTITFPAVSEYGGVFEFSPNPNNTYIWGTGDGAGAMSLYDNTYNGTQDYLRNSVANDYIVGSPVSYAYLLNPDGSLLSQADWRIPVDYTLKPGDVGEAQLYLRGDGPNVTLSVTRVWTYVEPPPVPEPATWALMILGMAFVGISARRGSIGRVGYSALI